MSGGARTFTVFCPFGGVGGGALGFQRARSSFLGKLGGFRLIGGIDNDANRCADFRYLTGVEEACADVGAMTPAELRAVAGERAPDVIFGSPPCKGSSKLLSSAKAREAKYAAMNELALALTRLLVEAWPAEPPKLVIYENVPNITVRARRMLLEVRRLLKCAGYALQDGFHECGEVGGLAQRRKRWFLVARHEAQVPQFLYRPPKRRIRACGEVLSELPMPQDPAGGPMHRLPEISALNWFRLAAIPPGGDWRDLIQDGTPRRARFRRHHVERWTDPSITVAGSGSNGPCGVADPREGAGAAADPEARLALNLGPNAHHNLYQVASFNEPTGTVTGSTRPGNGAVSVADPRLVPQAGNVGMHYGKYVVVPWSGPARTVTAAARVGSGAQAVADIRVKGFRGAYGVLSQDEPAATVTGNGRPAAGPFSWAAPLPLVPDKPCYDRGYGVLSKGEPSPTVAATSAVGCGAYAVAEERQPYEVEVDVSVGCRPRAGAYGVLPWSEASKVITGAACIDNGRFAVADPTCPEIPIAIIDDIRRPPFRWVEESAKGRGKPRTRREVVPLVIIAADGTWHRPLTTLELAVLQGFSWQHRGAPLLFRGGNIEQREAIGNAVPPPVGEAIGEQMLLCLLAASSRGFALGLSDGAIWVDPKKPWAIRQRPLVLDDGAVPKRARATSRKGGRHGRRGADRAAARGTEGIRVGRPQ